MKAMISPVRQPGKHRIVADAIARARPRPRDTVGRPSKALVRLASLLPDRPLDRLLGASTKPHLPKSGFSAAEPHTRGTVDA